MSHFFHIAAEAEHLESVAFFESKRPGLGASSLADFERALGVVCEAPGRYPIEEQPDVRRVRRSSSRKASSRSWTGSSKRRRVSVSPPS